MIGAHDDLELPKVSSQVDWEAELAVVVGRPLRRATSQEARAAIGSFTVANDVTMRDCNDERPSGCRASRSNGRCLSGRSS